MSVQSFDLRRGVNAVEKALKHRQFCDGVDCPFRCAAFGVAACQPQQKRCARDHHHPPEILRDDSLHGYPTLTKPIGQPVGPGLAINTRVRVLLFTRDGCEEIGGKGDLSAVFITSCLLPSIKDSQIRGRSANGMPEGKHCNPHGFRRGDNARMRGS